MQAIFGIEGDAVGDAGSDNMHSVLTRRTSAGNCHRHSDTCMQV